MCPRLKLGAAIEERFRSAHKQVTVDWHPRHHPTKQVDLDMFVEVDSNVSAKDDVKRLREWKRVE
jgi:hypothetical protein